MALQRSVRSGRRQYGQECAENVLAPIQARQINDESGAGVGVQAGPLRPDWGDGFADLECSICPAGWTGRIGSWCAYCLGRNQRAEFETAELVLRPGLPERGDQQYAGALKAWAERLARAVESGLIEESAAIAAYERER